MRFGRTEKITLLILFVVIVVAASIAYIVFNRSNEVPSDASVTLADRDGSEQFTDVYGNTFSFNDLENQIRVLNLWATWSPQSRSELIALNDLAAKYDSSDVVIVALNRMESPDRVDAFLSKLGSLPNLQLVQDPTDGYYQDVEGYTMPATIVYDSEGMITFEIEGQLNITKLKQHLDSLLTE